MHKCSPLEFYLPILEDVFTVRLGVRRDLRRARSHLHRLQLAAVLLVLVHAVEPLEGREVVVAYQVLRAIFKLLYIKVPEPTTYSQFKRYRFKQNTTMTPIHYNEGIDRGRRIAPIERSWVQCLFITTIYVQTWICLYWSGCLIQVILGLGGCVKYLIFVYLQSPTFEANKFYQMSKILTL